MAYPVLMDTPPALLHEVWERTPPEAQASMRALEARVETLTSMVRALQAQVGTLQEQLHQTSRRIAGGGGGGVGCFNSCQNDFWLGRRPTISSVPGPVTLLGIEMDGFEESL